MKLILVNERLGYSSTTSYTLDLCRMLRDRGHELRLCTGGGDLYESFREEGFESYTVKFNFFSFRKLTQFLREFGADLMHVQNLRSIKMGQRIADRLEVPHLVTVHHVPQGDCDELHHPLLAGVIAVNEAIRESLVNAQRIPKELIRSLRRGVNLDLFQPDEVPFNNPGRIPSIGSIGRLSSVKGQRYLIEAARHVLDSGHDAMFFLVGEGEEERSLRKQVAALGLEKRVVFCPPLADVAELIRNFDIVVVPTLRGGVGLAALEAMAMARPVVASAVGELLQLITDGSTGLVVKERDSEAIGDRIIHLIENPEEARNLGTAARSYVQENYSLVSMVDETEEFYTELLEEFDSESATHGTA